MNVTRLHSAGTHGGPWHRRTDDRKTAPSEGAHRGGPCACAPVIASAVRPPQRKWQGPRRCNSCWRNDLLVGANRCASQADPDPAASVPRALSHAKRDVVCSRHILPHLARCFACRSARATSMSFHAHRVSVCSSRRRCVLSHV